ncbi:MAG TPA: ring-opening amidohydrolase [Alphaproteobacteria bacterium]|nr:ring-opening amidohydrolase [Alphaproteobacteria bacterium]
MTAMKQALVFRVPMADPGDASALETLLESGALTAQEIVAIFGKTEGNGCVNDFTRPYAIEALKTALAPRLGCSRAEVAHRIGMVMSGGTEGGLSPHFIIYGVRQAPTRQSPGKRLAIGTAATRPFLAEEIGRMAQIRETAVAVRAAIKDAGIGSEADVHFVQVKCPLITAQRHAEAMARGKRPATHDTYASMGLSRGASALGVGLALGELDEAALSDDVVCHDYGLWSGRASVSAGIELLNNEVIVFGNSDAWSGDLVISHAVMRDAIDVPALHDALAGAGIAVERQLTDAQRERVRALLVKAEPSSVGHIRGARHAMLDDSDIPATRHARAFVGGAIAGLIGRTDLFVSGGAEHQGPDGGGPVAVIAAST